MAKKWTVKNDFYIKTTNEGVAFVSNGKSGRFFWVASPRDTKMNEGQRGISATALGAKMQATKVLNLFV